MTAEITCQNLTARQRIVLDFIPAGHENAISRRRLAQVTSLDDRSVREIIYGLVVERGLPIGSSTGPEGGGYFIIQDEEDLATRHLKPRARAIFRRAQALEKIARTKFSRQLRMVLNE